VHRVSTLTDELGRKSSGINHSVEKLELNPIQRHEMRRNDLAGIWRLLGGSRKVPTKYSVTVPPDK
jgi:hypothetical protein